MVARAISKSLYTYTCVSFALQVSSLFVVELLHRIVDTLEHYLDFNVSEKTIRRQFSVVYQVCFFAVMEKNIRTSGMVIA